MCGVLIVNLRERKDGCYFLTGKIFESPVHVGKHLEGFCKMVAWFDNDLRYHNAINFK